MYYGAFHDKRVSRTLRFSVSVFALTALTCALSKVNSTIVEPLPLNMLYLPNCTQGNDLT